MKKRFNDTGLCVPEKHYMVDISHKISQIMELVEQGDYFTINRPRQFGKTTIAFKIFSQLSEREDYLVLDLSFEGVGDSLFENQTSFAERFLSYLRHEIEMTYPQFLPYFNYEAEENTGLDYLSQKITRFTQAINRKIVLVIDEVDKSSNSQLFLSFLGMLREKYLKRGKNRDHTFHSVILIGVHDIKTIKLKLRPNAEHKLNSPWNIAVDFDIDLSFSATEIQSMLKQYTDETGHQINITAVADAIFYYTSGYPYLVSKMCKIIDEKFLPQRNAKNWTLDDVENAMKYLVKGSYKTILFDDLVKNLENNPELYDFVYDLIINGKRPNFYLDDPVVNQGHLYGIIAEDNGLCVIHNRIFEQRIYGYMLSKTIRESSESHLFSEQYIYDNELNVLHILKRFQQFMRENYAKCDQQFLEREGRLLFLSFLKPIINGKGFEFKEPVVGDERRMDLVITFGEKRHVLELKIWRGEQYHQQGLQQLSNYLDMYALKKGYLLIFDFRKEKQYQHQTIRFQDKEIEAIWV